MNKNIFNSNNYFRIGAMLVVLVLWSTVSVITAFFWTVFIIWWAYRIDSRILGGITLLFLVCIPVFLYIGQEARGEQIAVYTFFLLTMTVALQIIEYRRNSRGKDIEHILQDEIHMEAPSHILTVRHLRDIPRIRPLVGGEIKRRMV